WQSLALALANKGFTVTLPANSTIKVGDSQKVQICFTPQSGTAGDTLVLSDGCTNLKAIVIGSTKGVPDFAVSDYDFGCRRVGRTLTTNLILSNLSDVSVQIDSVWIVGSAAFGFDTNFPASNKLRSIVLANGQHAYQFSFTAPSVGPFAATAYFFNK